MTVDQDQTADKKPNIPRVLSHAHGYACEALTGVRRAQIALQELMNLIECGDEPGGRAYERIARHLRFAAGALDVQRDELAEVGAAKPLKAESVQ
jgi:hypothetical protein